MTNNASAYGQDLAADLLADLTRPLPVARLPKQPDPLITVDSVRSAAARETGRRGPALDGSLRISPLEWCKPAMSIGLQLATIRFGPVRAQLGIRHGGRTDR